MCKEQVAKFTIKKINAMPPPQTKKKNNQETKAKIVVTIQLMLLCYLSVCLGDSHLPQKVTTKQNIEMY